MTKYIYLTKGGDVKVSSRKPKASVWIAVGDNFRRITVFHNGALHQFDLDKFLKFCGGNEVTWFADVVSRLYVLSVPVELIRELTEMFYAGCE